MIVAFSTQIDNNWIIKYNIEVAQLISQKLSIGNPPSLTSLNPKKHLAPNEAPYIHRRYTGPGNAVILFTHGDEEYIYYGDATDMTERYRLNAREFCQIYSRINGIHDLPLILISCNSGRMNLAQSISNILGITVIAPQSCTIFSSRGLTTVNRQDEEAVSDEQEILEAHLPRYSSREIFDNLTDYVIGNNYGQFVSWNNIFNALEQYADLGLVRYEPHPM